jgi:hypothetical protein
MAVNISKEKQAAAFRMLREKTTFNAAIECGFEKYFDNKRQILNYMYKLFLRVKNNPEEYSIHPKTVEEVIVAMDSRNLGKVKNGTVKFDALQKKLSDVKDHDMKEVISIGRNKSAVLLDKKMNMLLRSKKALEKESIVSLAKVFSTYFDKGQIMSGQATENIAVLAKNVPDDITPEQAMAELIKRREKELEDK